LLQIVALGLAPSAFDSRLAGHARAAQAMDRKGFQWALLRHTALYVKSRRLTHGTSPSDFGEILKPFEIIDFFEHQRALFGGPFHTPLGVATLIYIAEDPVSLRETRHITRGIN
jgi:hypothetical protein